MKKIRLLLILLALSIGIPKVKAQEAPKREMRSVWLTTVWGLDWPANTIPYTGSNYHINQQKNQLTYILDKLKEANINTVFFQVRSECDAMYKSSYEPWSVYLVASRGIDPGYDPLEFAIEECHKRGMELHAWLNPYRFESSVGKYSGKAGDYRQTNPEWVLEYPDGSNGKKNVSILDPGNPDVRKRVVDIVKEIITNYDVDGITFDDYFYAYGGTHDNLDKYSQDRYKPASMNLHDWRRYNVNKMVADVYNMIQETEPWVTFGLSPFGIWTTDANVAKKENIELPSGIRGANMYREIYCDPVAWLKEGTVDYISPQLYWPTTSSGQDYDVLSPWWSNIANRFHRHFYPSQNLYGLSPINAIVAEKSANPDNLAIELNGLSMLEYHVKHNNSLKSAMDLPPSEIIKQIIANRISDKNGAPGSVFFRVNNFFTQGFISLLNNGLYKYKAMAPAISWKSTTKKGIPYNIKIENDTLFWDSNDNNVRFVVYAIPNEIANTPGNFATPKYILDLSYTKSFDLSEHTALITSHKFAVATLDRYGNESPVGLMGHNANRNKPTTLLSPIENKEVYKPFKFEWESISNAEYYLFEVSTDVNFSNIFYQRQITSTEFDAEDLSIEENTKYFWRVKTRAISVADTASKVESFFFIPEPSPNVLEPKNNDTEVSLTPTISWENFGDGYNYDVQISYTNTFTSNIIDETNISSLSYTVPTKKLNAFATYFIRVRAKNSNTYSAWSDVIKISTIREIPAIPIILTPTENQTISSPDIAVSVQEDPKALSFRIELSKSPTFPWTDRKVLTISSFQYEGSYKSLPAATYYLRARANYSNKYTDWSEVRSFKLSGTSLATVEGSNLELLCPTKLPNANVPVKFTLPSSGHTKLALYSITGNLVLELVNSKLPEGEHEINLPADLLLGNSMYLLSLQTNYGRKTLKLVK